VKGLLVLLTLACAFGLAALWQKDKLRELHAARLEAAQVADGTLAPTPSGALPEGKGVVIVGRPSGVEPLFVPEKPLPEGDASPEPETGTVDFELEVMPGQTLSGIAQIVYGSAARPLILRLAEYNDLADPDNLSAGRTIWLPPIEKLR
jgi:hypothetical protein